MMHTICTLSATMVTNLSNLQAITETPNGLSIRLLFHLLLVCTRPLPGGGGRVKRQEKRGGAYYWIDHSPIYAFRRGLKIFLG